MTLAIELTDVSKIYNHTTRALESVSMSIPKGSFYGLLGPNGAGKSTTIGILCSLINKTSGNVTINGHNIDTHWSEAKQCLGIVPQEFNFSIFESCLQIVVNQAGYYGVPYSVAQHRADSLLKDLGLWDKRHQPAGRLSGGMKRRLMIARALAHEPEILILDEPTAGVDISLRRSMWDFLQKQNKKGLTIILTTHYLEEAEQLCDTIAIIDKGKIIENTSKAQLLDMLHSETYVLFSQPTSTLPTLDKAHFSFNSEGHIEVELKKEVSITTLINSLKEQGIIVDRIQTKSNRLEALFVKLVEEQRSE
jgi:ABC-2 type transport system ATP-binding protein